MKKQKDYNSYKIKKGDTLHNIAEALGKDYSEVARFHNIYAKQDDLIGMEFPKTLKELFIFPNISEKHIDNIPKTNFLYDSKLALKPFNKKLVYEVQTTQIIENNFFVLKYEKTVCYLKKVREYYIFEIDSILIDESELSGISVEFNAQVTKAIYPLELVITDEGNWIGIYNFENITKKWHDLKENIEDNFEGDETKKLLDFYDALFKDESRCTRLLRQDIFLQTFFNNLYDNHTQRYFFERKVYFAILPNVAPVCFAVIQNVEEYVNEQNQIEITQKGIYEDERSCMDFEYELNSAFYDGRMPTGSYMATYKLNSASNCIENVDLYCDLDLLKSQEIKVKIKLVD